MIGTTATFPGKHPDEVIIFIQRKHWSLVVGHVFRWVVLMVLPIAAYLLLRMSDTIPEVEPGSAGSVAITFGISTYLLIVWMLFFQDWLDYYLDALILSNERVIRIEQASIFNRTVSQLSLDRIQDVTIASKGMVPSLFGFGTITIESAGEQENFVLKNMPDIEAVQSKILMYAKQAPRMGMERTSEAKKGGPSNVPPKPPLTGKP